MPVFLVVLQTVFVLVVLWFCGYMTQRPIQFHNRQLVGRTHVAWLAAAVAILLGGLIIIDASAAPYVITFGTVAYAYGLFGRTIRLALKESRR